MALGAEEPSAGRIKFVNYQSEVQMIDIKELVQKDLSEPYSVYTYRYFINNWSKLCFLAYDKNQCVGAIVCKLDARDTRDPVKSSMGMETYDSNAPVITYKGYIAMLVVKEEYRKLKIGSNLVKLAVNAMRESRADEVVLETEVTNKPALKLYENLGFLRDKRLFRYYLNGVDALRLKLWIDTSKRECDHGTATNIPETLNWGLTSAMASLSVDNTQTKSAISEKTSHDNNTTGVIASD